MNKFKDMPVGISLFLIFLFLLNIVYFCVISFSEGIFADYGYTLDNITAVAHILIVVFLGILIALGLYFVLLGFIRRDVWARKFTIVFIVWSALWPIWGLLVGNLVSAHVVILIIDVLMIIYLLTEYVREYFEGGKVFRWGDWTLYVRMVVLKNDGRERPIYFFSKKTPKSGTPCAMPDGYEVGISDRSSMPYLQKIGKPKPYKHGDWTLYKRKVRLNGGKVITIYFFSRGKPKSGVASPLPDGYEVGINKRSGMPFLRKKTSKKTVEEVKEQKIEEDIDKKSSIDSKKKSANVIYVVSKPQPGQVKGDWAVRSHKKIFSHHRTKINAIREARKIAKKIDATVLVQKTDGTFSEGFKPK